MTMPSNLELILINSCGKQPAYLKELIEQIWPIRAKEIYSLFVDNPIDVNISEDYPHVVKLNGEAIGLTGYYYYDETSVGLCWHGIHPKYQKQGLSKIVFQQVCLMARKHYPNAQHIIEIIPSDKIHNLVPYFTKLGFKDTNKLATFDYLPKSVTWHIYQAPLVFFCF